MAAAAQRAAARMGDYGVNTQYIIATPNGVVDQRSTTHQFCAWHNWTDAGSSWVTYMSMPYQDQTYFTQLGGGRNAMNAGSSGLLDGVTINASHEYAESVTDPALYSWLDSDSNENGDKCSWVNLTNYTLANNMAFPVQPTWSNQGRTATGNGCLYQ